LISVELVVKTFCKYRKFKMFKLVSIALFAVSLHLSLALPQDAPKPPVPIVSQSSSIDGTGSFNYAFETGDGIKEEASGSLKSLKVPKVDPATGQVVGEEDGQGKYFDE
jgi:hypothetical protein